MMLSLQSVSSSNLDLVWESICPILKRATDMSRGRMEPEDLKEDIRADLINLWLVLDGNKAVAAVTLTVKAYPRMKVLLGLYIAGDRMEEWQDMVCAALERYAREMGCQRIEFVGRPGWGRVLSRNGYEQAFASYEKTVDD